MIHHYYFTVKGNWGATRARGEKKVHHHLQISQQNPQKSSAGHCHTDRSPLTSLQQWLYVELQRKSYQAMAVHSPPEVTANSFENCSPSCLHKNSGRQPTYSHWMQALTHKHVKKKSEFVKGTVTARVLLLPSMVMAAELHRKKSLLPPESLVLERSREKCNKDLEKTRFPLSEEHHATVGMHEQCYSAKSSI